MIRHVVFFSATNPEDISAIFDGLSILADIPNALLFEVRRNLKVDKINGKDPDFIVYAEFADQEALDAYKAHPLYEKSISIVRPLRDIRIAADFLG